MTSRERVNRSLAFDLEGRVPRDMWTLPWAEKHHPGRVKAIGEEFPNDIATAPCIYREEPKRTGDPYALGEYVDEWGCRFTSIQEGVIGEVKELVLDSWDALDNLRPPEELLTLDTDEVNAFCSSSKCFVLQGTCARPFERMQFLRKSEDLYIDIAEESPEFYELLLKVHGFFLAEMALWAGTDVDALYFMDDWGTQQSLLISPESWRRIFKPMYRDYVDLAHAQGKKCFMHSDGYTADIIPDLIQIGVDALNTQIFCIGLENLEQYRGQICFWGEIDRQHLLPSGEGHEIDAGVDAVKQHLYDRGGIIAQCEFGAGARPENVRRVFQRWDEITRS